MALAPENETRLITEPTGDDSPENSEFQNALDQLNTTFQPIKITWAYRVWMLAVAAVMVLLPVVYVALIGLILYGILVHISLSPEYMASLFSIRVRAIAYITPVVVGMILILFMIKPLFSKQSQKYQPVAIDPEKENRFFTFVKQLCVLLHAPIPSRIDLNQDINASAGFRGGMWNGLVRQDLVLTVGLPLMDGLSLEQFTGVIAHELGHFTQGFGMKLSYLIRNINQWFAQAVYEEDEWDEKLIQWSDSWDYRLQFILSIARFFVFVTRRILWVLMMIGQAVSCSLLRQMECNADRYQAWLVGAETFRNTSQRLEVLEIAHEQAMNDLYAAWDDRDLVDNFPALITDIADSFSSDLMAQIENVHSQEKTRVFSTHPCTRDRIAHVDANQTPGVFHSSLPASILLHHFKDLSRRISLAFYHYQLGSHVRLSQLIPVEVVKNNRIETRTIISAIDRYLSRDLMNQGPFAIPADMFSEPVHSFDSQLMKIRQAKQNVIRIRTEMDSRKSAVPDSKNDKSAGRTEPSLITRLKEAVIQRLMGTIVFLDNTELQTKVANCKSLRTQRDRFLPVLATLNAVMDRSIALNENGRRVGHTVERLHENMQDYTLKAELTRRQEKLYLNLKEIRDTLPEMLYPFDHKKINITVSEYLLDEVPPKDDLLSLMRGTQDFLGRFYNLYFRLMGHLILIAESVESQLEV